MRKTIIDQVLSDCERLRVTPFKFLQDVGTTEQIEAFMAKYGCLCQIPGSPGPCFERGGSLKFEQVFLIDEGTLTRPQQRELARLRDLA
ncbi:hypothetical protein HQ571_00570 [Candidatus Kuenenbacteria bacterium]|nr:hypothetical protein [Candidatus Kuenenbacteria bacterium]